MAKKNHNTAIGIDIGRNTQKAVLLRKSSGGINLTNYAILPRTAPLEALIKKLGATASVYVTAINSPDAILRIIPERKTTPEKLLAVISSKGRELFNDKDPAQYFLDCTDLLRIRHTHIRPRAVARNPATPRQGERVILYEAHQVEYSVGQMFEQELERT